MTPTVTGTPRSSAAATTAMTTTRTFTRARRRSATWRTWTRTATPRRWREPKAISTATGSSTFSVATRWAIGRAAGPIATTWRRRSGPGMDDMCDGHDNDCDGEADEGFEDLTFFADCDRDGFGDGAAFGVVDCDVPRELPMSCPAGGDPLWSTNPDDCDDDDPSRHSNCGECAAVDVLFVIDTTASMMQEQVMLASAVDAIGAALASPAGAGVERVHDVHVGVITADMGTQDVDPTVSGCAFGPGDDAQLLFSSAAAAPACRTLMGGRRAALSLVGPGERDLHASGLLRGLVLSGARGQHGLPLSSTARVRAQGDHPRGLADSVLARRAGPRRRAQRGLPARRRDLGARGRHGRR